LKIYQATDADLFERYIYEFFAKLGHLLIHKAVKDIIAQFELVKAETLLDLKQDPALISFKNGLLNIETMEFSNPGPEVFVTSRLSFDYIYGTTNHLDIWLKYMNDFTSNNEDHIEFLRSYMKLIIANEMSTQTFLYIVGPGGSGKSVFLNVCVALVGQEQTLSSSLRAINSDKFEAANINGKSLLILTDSEHYTGDQSKIKAIIGNDRIMARKIFVQGAFNFYSQCLVIIVSNFNLGSTDTSAGLERRIRLYEAHKVVPKRRLLLEAKGSNITGELVKALPAIFNWVFEMPLETAKQTIKTCNPGQHLLEGLNPMKDWAKDELEKGEDAYLGYIKGLSKRDRTLASRSVNLYAYYEAYCERQGYLKVSHKEFFSQLKNSVEWKIDKKRSAKGIKVEGVKLKDEVLERGLEFAGPIETETTETVLDSEYKAQFQLSSFKHLSDNEIMKSELYTTYINNAKAAKNKFKRNLNNLVKKNVPDSRPIADEYLKQSKAPSKAYKKQVHKIFKDCQVKIEKYGPIPLDYKMMGTSPRILPLHYGKTLNSTKKMFREHIYALIPGLLDNKFTVIDFDLKSCYNSILIGLYPDDLSNIKMAIEGKGLWNYLKEDFEKKGIGKYWDKGSVKICVYSSFFFGGTKAMVEGILNANRTQIGLTQAEFDDWQGKVEIQTRAEKIAKFMMESPVIEDFRAVAKHIFETYQGHSLVGPTAHHYAITEDSETMK